MEYIAGGLVFGLGMLLLIRLNSNRTATLISMTLAAFVASAIMAWGMEPLADRIWMFLVMFLSAWLGYYGSARLLYGNDYWKR